VAAALSAIPVPRSEPVPASPAEPGADPTPAAPAAGGPGSRERELLEEEIALLAAQLRDEAGQAIPRPPWRHPLVAGLVGAIGVLVVLLGAMSVIGALL
jgi:hypothetical protein